MKTANPWSFAVALVLTVACDAPQSAPLAVDHKRPEARAHANANVPASAEVSQWLAGLRAATARFQRIEAAAQAGWGVELTQCMDLPGTGAMGFHYANMGLIDGMPEEFAPELLVYEPQKNGGLKLVAVEYIVPFTAWTDDDPPALHGIAFHRNEAFQLWVLHAWIWKHNPLGIFADWNPQASCEFE